MLSHRSTNLRQTIGKLLIQSLPTIPSFLILLSLADVQQTFSPQTGSAGHYTKRFGPNLKLSSGFLRPDFDFFTKKYCGSFGVFCYDSMPSLTSFETLGLKVSINTLQ